jgi:23S rRNA G2445 N2-methylase RlmL
VTRAHADPIALFAACAPGLEPMLRDEIAALGAPDATAVAGGVELSGDLALLYRLNLELGLALKLLARLGELEVTRFPALVDRTAELPWERWCAPGAPVDVRAR